MYLKGKLRISSITRDYDNSNLGWSDRQLQSYKIPKTFFSLLFCIDWKRWWQTQKGEQLKKQVTVRMQLRKAAKFPHARCIRSCNKPMKFSYRIEFHFEWYQCSILREVNGILKQIIKKSILQKSTSLFIIQENATILDKTVEALWNE